MWYEDDSTRRVIIGFVDHKLRDSNVTITSENSTSRDDTFGSITDADAATVAPEEGERIREAASL